MQQPEKAIKLAAGVDFKDEGRTLFTEQRGRGLQDIDPRVKILISLSFGIMLLVTAREETVLLSVLIGFAVLLLSGKGKTGVNYLSIYAFCSLAIFLAPFTGWKNLSLFFSVFLYTLLKFIPLAMLGSWLILTVKTGELIAALEKMLLPATIVIPLAVLFRFLPTLKEEFNYIRDTMKMRNIDLDAGSLLLHPARTVEYILVPLLMRSVKVSDELAAAALARGLDGGKQRSSLRQVRILFGDVVVAVFFIVVVAALWYLDHSFFARGGRIWLCWK